MDHKKYKCYVDGSHGFIGTHLVNKLKELGWTVVRGDRDGNLPSQVDYIFSLASYGNYHYQDNPSETFLANVTRLITLLSQVKKIKGIVLTSSSSVLLPTKTFYSVSKQTIEGLAEVYDLPIVVARPSTIIGIGEAEHHLIPKLINSCFTSVKMDFVKSPIHDFLAVDDYVEAIIKMAQNAKKLKGKTLNVSMGKSLSNEEIKNIVERQAGSKASVKYVKSLRSYDSKHWIVKPAKELKKLGWKPKVKIEKVIDEMITEASLNRI